MDKSKTSTLSQQLLARVMERRVVAYAIVGATIVGSIATFFGSIDKLLASYTNIEKSLSRPPAVAPERAPSIWIRIDQLEVIDKAGIKAEVAKADFFVRTPRIPVTEAILDPLPLKVEASDGTTPPPRRLPRRDPYGLFDPVWIESDTYPLMDVEQVLMPSGRAVLRKKGEKDRVVYVDQNLKEVTLDKVEHHIETWGRLANLPRFERK